MRTDDGYIIHKCLNGESEAFGLLIDKYKAGIYAFIYNKLRNLHDAEDVSQDVFIHAYQKLNTLRRWDSFVGWLYRIASNLCKNFLISQSKRPDGDFIEDKHPKALEEQPTDSHRDDAIYDYLDEALNSLPETYRQALTLYYMGGMNSTEIAKALCISPAAVRHRLSRARAQLREEVLAMMSENYKKQRLESLFTFRIVEAIKNIKIHPIPRITGLSWGLSTAVGIMIAVLGLGHYLVLSEPIYIPKAPELLSQPKVLKTGEIPVNVLQVSDIPFLASNQKNEPQIQQKAFLAPQAEPGQWTRKSDMPTPRGGLGSCMVKDKIYAIGGLSDAADILAIVEEYDPASDKWAKKADMPTPRVHLSANVVNGKIYAIGGGSKSGPLTIVEEYDPIADRWTKKSDMPTARSYFSASVVNEKIYAFGGRGLNGHVTTVEEYDPVADKWTKKSDMLGQRSFFTACALDGKIYTIGGWIPGGGLSSVDEYDPIADKWTRKADMPTQRASFAICVLNGKIYLFGGEGDGQIPLSVVEEYDPITDKWTKKPDMPMANSYFTASVVNGKAYIIGGTQDGASVEEYTPEGWTSSAVFPQNKFPTKWGEIKN